MTEATKIAEERYARGEISLEELQKIKDNIGTSNNIDQSIAATSGSADESSSVNSKIATGLKYFGGILIALAIGNTFMVLPDENKKLQSMNPNSSMALVQKNEVENIKLRTRNFFIFGAICFGAGFFINRKN